MIFFKNLDNLLIIAILYISFLHHQFALGYQLGFNGGGVDAQRRMLGFKEKAGGDNNINNSTFECSPSGPCVACQYSEKSDDKYRCSETGYRIPFKCIKLGSSTKEGSSKGPQNSGSTGGSAVNANNAAGKQASSDNVSGQDVERQEYVTYRSCIQGVNEEKLSVLGFEVLMLGMLLLSASFVVLRRKKTVAMAGVGGVRLQTNPRF